MEKSIIKFIICILCVSNVSPAKILYVGLPLYSHFRNVAFIGDELINRGHEVWMTATPSLARKLNLKERKMKMIPFSDPEALDRDTEAFFSRPSDVYLRTGERPVDFDAFKGYQHKILNDSVLLSSIEEQHFDLMIVDSTPIAVMLVLIPYKFNVSFILCGAYYDPLALRVPFSPAVTPFELFETTDRMSFFERLRSTIWHPLFTYYSPFSYGNAARLYVPERPNIRLADIMKKADLVFYEYDLLSKYPQSTMPNIILLGDVTPASATPIPSQFQTFLKKSQNGVVLVSFGSMSGTEDNPIFDKLISAFKQTKYNYIIKGEFAQSDDQILAVNWIPQASLLNHPKIKLFITHCGANGIREGILSGVPMLGFPLFAEQPGNAFRMQARGFGIKMDLFWAKEDDIVKSINELIINPQYKNTVKRASEFMNAQKVNATLEAVFWIEHILKFGGEYLRSAGVDLPLYQYLLLDVIFVIICIMLVVIVIMYIICKCICNRISSKTKTKRE